MFTPAQVDAAIKAHGTIFFDGELNPVVPEPGQWFCEFDLIIPEEGDNFIRDESLVEYLGPCDSVVLDDSGKPVPYGDPKQRFRVLPEYAEEDRRPNGVILVRQS